MQIIDESAALLERIFHISDAPLYEESTRIDLNDIACSMSLEHWESTLDQLNVSNLTSTIVVHRAQFEATPRSIWLLYAASDEQLGKLFDKLNSETEQQAKNLPQPADMMVAISKKGPPQAFDALNRSKNTIGKR